MPTPQNKPARKRPAPPDQTHAEAYYYVKQMQNRTPMTVVLKDGESLHGVIEWYDRTCIKINRSEGPNLLIYKDSIKYIYKAGEARRTGAEAAGDEADEES
ncbi:MAG: hypothetical protein GC160_08565 [Acidobacteria bacterium]|nr:hypothetical protein [Acidobacteriota bacterium]